MGLAQCQPSSRQHSESQTKPWPASPTDPLTRPPAKPEAFCMRAPASCKRQQCILLPALQGHDGGACAPVCLGSNSQLLLGQRALERSGSFIFDLSSVH